MNALLLVPLIAIAIAVLYQPKRPERIGYVERTARGCRPLPPMSRRQRLHRWMALYNQTTVEQQTAAGDWPFTPSAVHELPRSAMTDVRELVR